MTLTQFLTENDMSRMAELDTDIRDRLDDGETPSQIAHALKIPVQMICDMVDSETPEDSHYNDSMDGDFDSAMASAGFGTDEDYGYYGEDE